MGWDRIHFFMSAKLKAVVPLDKHAQKRVDLDFQEVVRLLLQTGCRSRYL